MEKPSYYGILPAKVRYDKRLKPMEKILYSEISALANTYGYCYAGNSYFGELYEVHKNTVGVWINNLVECGYLKVKLIYKARSKEVKERRLYLEEGDYLINKKIDTPSIKSLIPSQEKSCPPINENIEDNTTRDNNIKVNNINTTTRGIDSSSSDLKKSSMEDKKENIPLVSGDKAQIVEVLKRFGASEKTIKNILSLDVTLERVEVILKRAKEKSWGEGAIYKGLKENWTVEERKNSLISDEELEEKRKWLRYFAGLDRVIQGEVLEIIKPIPMEKLEKNKKRLARTESIFEFKQELKRLSK